MLAPNENQIAQSVVLWETAEDAVAATKDPAVQPIVEELVALVVAAPISEVHPVTLNDRG